MKNKQTLIVSIAITLFSTFYSCAKTNLFLKETTKTDQLKSDLLALNQKHYTNIYTQSTAKQLAVLSNAKTKSQGTYVGASGEPTNTTSSF